MVFLLLAALPLFLLLVTDASAASATGVRSDAATTLYAHVRRFGDRPLVDDRCTLAPSDAAHPWPPPRMLSELKPPYPTNDWFVNFFMFDLKMTQRSDPNSQTGTMVKQWPYAMRMPSPGRQRSGQLLQLCMPPVDVTSRELRDRLDFSEFAIGAERSSNGAALGADPTDRNSASAARLVEYDKLVATLRWTWSGIGSLTAPVARGAALLTFLYEGAAVQPRLVFGSAIRSVEPREGTKLRVTLSNQNTWLVYTSAPVQAALADGNLRLSLQRVGSSASKLVVQTARLHDKSAETEKAYDASRGTYAVRGTHRMDHIRRSVEASGPSTDAGMLTLQYQVVGEASSLLLWSLPHHREAMATPSVLAALGNAEAFGSAQLVEGVPPLRGILGMMRLMRGNTWSLLEPWLPPATWSAPYGLDTTASQQEELRAAVLRDVDNKSFDVPDATNEDLFEYFVMKGLVRLARLQGMAEEVREPVAATRMSDLLAQRMAPWLETSAKSHFRIETSYGGVVPRRTIASDGECRALGPTWQCGAGWYADHVFRYGYFIYASSHVMRLNRSWRDKYRTRVLDMVRDIASPVRQAFAGDSECPGFPALRYFDLWEGHTLATGIKFMVKNFESTSQAILSHYGLALLGRELQIDDLALLGRMLVALETRTTRRYFHMTEGRLGLDEVYPPDTESMRARGSVGIVWNDRVSYDTHFGDNIEYIHGIQINPIGPHSLATYMTKDWARKALPDFLSARERASPKVTDKWVSYMAAMQMLTDEDAGLKLARNLGDYGDANTWSNMLWWAAALRATPDELYETSTSTQDDRYIPPPPAPEPGDSDFSGSVIMRRVTNIGLVTFGSLLVAVLLFALPAVLLRAEIDIGEHDHAE